MHKQLPVWQLIEQSLQQNIAVMLLYVLESNGSSPGRQGFAMCVNATMQMQGSIGGGIMEHKLVEMAKDELQYGHENSSASQVKKQVHDKSAAKNQSGMICSGDQTILLYRIKKAEQILVQKIIACLQANKNGQLELQPGKLDFSDDILLSNDFYFANTNEEKWLYQEKIGYKNRLFIIGGGHCSLALSNLMSSMDFYISLYEERDGLNTVNCNETVHEKHIIESYQHLLKLIPEGMNHYIVIMTFGYRTDYIAVKALTNRYYKYFGLMGSVKKIEKLFADLQKEGIAEEWISRIHSPIGIQINSKSPEEIAVSIAAEIIAVKNAR